MRPLRHVNASPAHHPRLAAQHLCCCSGTSKACQHTIPGWLPSTHLPRLHVVPGIGGVEVFVLADAVDRKESGRWLNQQVAKQTGMRCPKAGSRHGLQPQRRRRQQLSGSGSNGSGSSGSSNGSGSSSSSNGCSSGGAQGRSPSPVEEAGVAAAAVALSSRAQQPGAHLQSHSCRPLNSIFSSRLNVYVRKDSHLIHAGEGKRGA